MLSFKQDPYLWVHLAGLAVLPILLDICLAGLAVGDPILPVWLEMGALIAFGIVPIFWMQWQRPFYIFSLLLLAVKPGDLTEDRRRVLRLFRTKEVRVLTILVSVFLAWILWQLYRIAPIAAGVTPLSEFNRGIGLLVTGIAFLASNLFLQVPVSVARVLLTSDRAFTELDPYTVEQIPQNFSLFGLRISAILPEMISEPLIESESKSESLIEPISQKDASVDSAQAVDAVQAVAQAEAVVAQSSQSSMTADESSGASLEGAELESPGEDEWEDSVDEASQEVSVDEASQEASVDEANQAVAVDDADLEEASVDEASQAVPVDDASQAVAVDDTDLEEASVDEASQEDTSCQSERAASLDDIRPKVSLNEAELEMSLDNNAELGASLDEPEAFSSGTQLEASSDKDESNDSLSVQVSVDTEKVNPEKPPGYSD